VVSIAKGGRLCSTCDTGASEALLGSVSHGTMRSESGLPDLLYSRCVSLAHRTHSDLLKLGIAISQATPGG
jgi:hypothetical protein